MNLIFPIFLLEKDSRTRWVHSWPDGKKKDDQNEEELEEQVQFGFILFNPKNGGKISRLSNSIDIHDWNLRSALDWYLFSLLLRWEHLRSVHSAILLA